MSGMSSDAEKRNGKRSDIGGTSSGVTSTSKKPGSPRHAANQFPAFPNAAHIFDSDELPSLKANRKKSRKRERQERLEEQETVAQLIDSMRYGGEPKTRSYSRGRSIAGTEPGTTKNARIDTGGLRVRWARFKQRLGTGSAPSESLLDGTGESSNSSRSVHRFALGHNQHGGDDTDDGAEVDEVVVDNAVGTVTGGSQASEHGGTGRAASGSGRPDVAGGKSHTNSFGTMEMQSYGIWDSNFIFSFLRWTVWPLVLHFFTMRFGEDKTEYDYQKQTWWSNRTLGIYSSVFFVVNWILIVALNTRPFALSDTIFFYGIGPLIALPLPFLVIFDYPYKKRILFQLYLDVCVWAWAYYSTIFMYTCDFYGNRGPDHCGNRDFIGILFFAVGLPAIAMFGLRQTRIANTIGFTVFFIINCVLIVPEHTAYTRNMLDALLFHVFILYIHYKRESTERRNFSLREQLKVQFRATQKAQVNERRASDSKRRLTSYVFHEVRVPLNTAILAVQNLEAMGEIRWSKEIEWKALTGSLSMMSKVLNDVLDFDRLDSGRFSTVKTPYNFHQTIRAMLIPLDMAAKARSLTLVEDLDKNIDRIARRVALAAKGLNAPAIAAELAKSDEDGFVLGDEMRLRQIINNLASNACKFTPAGGNIRIVTRLIQPLVPSAATGGGTETVTEGVTPIALTASGAPSNALDAENGREDAADHLGIMETEQPTPGSKPTEHAKETEHSSLKSLRKSGFPWRWQSYRRRANTVTNDLDVHPRDMLDAAEKGAMPAPMPLSTAQLVRHNSVDLNNLDRIVVRIEVHDTGVGIRQRDLVDNKLFSPYVQTEIGKYQGGKGTGLGLALVRRIVKLSGGRLGVRSKLGEGSTFWVELPLGVGVSDSKDRPDLLHDGSDYSEGQRQLAFGLEDLKFARAIGEGETPSTMVIDQDTALAKDGEAEHCNVLALPCKRALKNVMDQQGLFEIAPPLLRSSRGAMERTPASTPKPDIPSPTSTSFDAMPLTPSQSGPESEGLDIPSTADSMPIGYDHDEKGNVITSIALTSPLPPFTSSYSAPGPLETSMTSISLNSPASKPTRKGVRVLVVDDDMITRSLMSRMLTRLGCVVTTAENGKIALEKILGGPIPSSVIRGEPGTGMGMSTGMPPQEVEQIPEDEQVYLFDIVFLDNQMPVMSGLDTVAALRALGRKDLIVGVTGNALLTDQQEYLDVGVDRVLTKPVLESSLTAMLNVAVRRRQKRSSALQGPSLPQ